MFDLDFLDFTVPRADVPGKKALIGVLAVGAVAAFARATITGKRSRKRPAAIATWRFGALCCERAGDLLAKDISALDACEDAVSVVELDETIRSFVGLGGLPRENGVMEHDAAMMDGASKNIGSVMSLHSIASPIRVARRVLEAEGVNCLVGEGAVRFAVSEGFMKENILTEAARAEWEQWCMQARSDSDADSAEPLHLFAFLSGAMHSPTPHQTPPSQHTPGHDTVGVITLDSTGNIAVGVSSSGKPFSASGRVGDAPVVGSGFYADNQYGAAVATGDGEEIMKTCVSFCVVELMRAGYSPQQACSRAIDRTREMCGPRPLPSVSVIAMNPRGNTGAATTIGPDCPCTTGKDSTSDPHRFQYATWSAASPTTIHSVTSTYTSRQ